MKYLLLNQHTGVHLRYDPNTLTNFIVNNGRKEFGKTKPQILSSIRNIFASKADNGGFIVLNLNGNDELIGIGVMVCNGRPKEFNRMHLLTYFAVHAEYNQASVVQGLLKSIMRFASSQVKLSPSVPESAFANLPNWEVDRMGNELYALRA